MWLPAPRVRFPAIVLLLTALVLGAAQDAASQTVTLSVPANTELAEGEGNTTVTVTATLSATRSAATVVDLTLGGTAKSTDYGIVGSLPDITIPNGQTVGTADVTLSPVDDSFFEGEETISIGGDATGLTVNGVDVQLTDNDTKPGFQFQALRTTDDSTYAISPSITYPEGTMLDARFTVSLTGGSVFEEDAVVTVSPDWTTPRPRRASADDFDFGVDPPWSVSIKAGTTFGSLDLSITLVDDSLEEDGEIFPINARLKAGGSDFMYSGVVFHIAASDLPISFVPRCNGGRQYPGETFTKSCWVDASRAVSRDYTLTLTASDTQVIDPDTLSFTMSNGSLQSDTKSVTFTAAADVPRSFRYNASLTPNDQREIISDLSLFFYSPARPGLEISTYQITGVNGHVTVGQRVSSFYFEGIGRPITIIGTPTAEIILDSGVVSAPCYSNVHGAIWCSYRIQEGDYDFDGQIEIPAGAVKFTGWRDVRDPTVTGTVASPLPARKETHKISYSVFGGSHAIELSLSLQTLQEGTGEQELTINARRFGSELLRSDLVIPLVFTDISTNSSDYSIRGTPSVTIPAGAVEGSAIVHFTPVDDLVKEAPVETVRIEGSKGAMMTPFVRGAELRLLDAAGIRLSASPETVAEDGGAQQVTVTAEWGDAGDSALATDVEVALAWGGTAGSGDYALSGGATVTIPANARSGSTTVTITPTDDKLLEGDETITISGSTPGRAVAQTEMTLADDETVPAVSIAVDTNAVQEGGSAQTVTVSATLDPDVAMANDVTTVTLGLGGTATGGGTDYTSSWSPSTPRITIPVNATEGSNTVSLTLTPVDDQSAEGDETIVVQGTATTQSRSLVVKVATIALEDDDEPGVNVSPGTLTVAEGATGTYEVWLGTRPASDVTVSLSSTDATVATVNKSELTFTPTTWDTRQEVTLTGEEDDRNNADDRRAATIRHTAGGGGYDDVEAAEVSVIVTDNDEAVSFSVADAAAAEGEAMTFTVTRSGATGEAASVEWKTAADEDGSHPASSADYAVQATAQTLGFAAGDTEMTFTVQTTGDSLDEEDETFLVKLSEPSAGASISVDTAIGRIADDDGAPELRIDAPSVTEGDAGAATLAFTVTLSAASGRDVTVGYADAASGTATSGADYAAITAGTVNFDAGETSKTVAVSVRGDAGDEANETVILRLSSPSNAVFSGSAATLDGTGTITDDDATTVTLGGGGTVREDGTDSADVTVSLGRNMVAGEEVTVPLSITGTGIASSDYIIDLKPGSSLNRGVSLETGNPYSAAAPAVVFAGHGTNAVQVATLRVRARQDRRDETASEALTVGFGSVTSNLDRADPSTTGTGGTTTSGTATVTITDDDDAGVTIAETGDPAATEVSEDGTTVTDTYTIVLDSKPTHAVTVTVSAAAGVKVNRSGGTAGSRQTLTFNPSGTTDLWSSPQTVTVTGVDDDIDNADDARTVAIGHAASSTDPDYVVADAGSVSVKVTDDDTKGVTVSAASAGLTIRETDDGGTTQTTENVATYTVVLASEPTGDVVIDVEVPAGAPFTASPSSLTFTPSGAGIWSTAQVVTVTAVDDNVDNTGNARSASITHALTVGSSDYGGVSVPGVTVTVTDDDAAPTALTLTVDADTETDNVQASVSEGGGAKTVRVTATLGGSTTFATDKAVTVEVGDDGDSAAEGTDYAMVGTQTVTIKAGASSGHADFTLTPTADSLHEGPETISVEGALSGVTVAGAEITITDDDSAPTTATLAVDADTGTGNVQASLAEGGGAKTVRVTATLGGSSTFTEAKTVTVEVGHADDGATEGTDYETVGRQEIEIAAGASGGHADFTLTPTDDAVDEESETISFKGTADGLTVADAEITLTDDDTKGVTVSAAASGLTVRETDDGGTTETTENVATYTVVLASEPTDDVVIDVEVPAGAPFTASPSRLTFTPGGAGIWSTAQVVTVTAVDDNVDNTGNARSASITHALTVGSSDYGGVSVPGVTVTVTDDDAAPTGLTLSVDADTATNNVQTSVSEGGGAKTVRVTATLDGATTFATDKAVTVEVGKSSDSAAEGTDYAMVGTQTITIKAGASSGHADFTLTPTDDAVDEESETISLDGTLAGVTVTDAEITLTDDDDAPGGIALSVDTDSVMAGSQTEVGEAAGATTVTVTATVTGSTTYSGAQTVAVSVSGDTATVADDFAAVTGFSITIPAGTASARGMFTLTPVADAIDENDETVDVTGTVSGDGAPAVTGATITITDDDTKGVTVSAASAGLTVRETDDGGTTQTTENVATYTVVLASEPTGDVVIDVEVPAGAPFTASPSSLTFTPSGAGIWSTAQVVTVTAVDDNVDNTGNARSASITHALTVGSSDYGGVSVPGVTVTVTDDDAAPTALTLTVDADTETDNVQASVSEGGGAKTVRVTATLGGSTTFATDKAVTVEVGDDGDSAAEGTDYAMVGTQTVTIKAGASSGHADFTLTPTADSLHEGPETISVEGALSGVTVAGAEITITDDDSAPTTATLAVDADTGTGNVQASLAEGGGAKTVRVTATLGGSSTFTEAKTVTVEVGHADDGATEGTDYETVGRQEIEIAAGASGGHADFTLTPTDDAVDEESETISFKGTADGLTVADAEITLTDDDTKGVTVSAAASGLTVRETDDGGTTETTENVATYTVVLASEPTDDVVIDVEVPAGAPFTASPSRLTFTPGGAGIWSTAQVVTVTAVDDNVDNTGNARSASITHALTVGSSDYGGVSVPGVTVTVTDDDAAPTGLTLSVDADTATNNVQTSVSEGGGAKTVRVTATLDGATTFATDKAVTVEVGKSSDSAAEGTDYAMVGTQTITIKAGASSGHADFTLTPTDDAVDEESETISLDGTLAGVTVTDAEITLTDDDDAPGGIALSVDTDSVMAGSQTEVGEAAGATTVTVTATVTGSTTYSGAQTVAVSVSGDTATVADDFAAVTGFSITIPAGTASARGMFTLTPVADAIDENDETVDVTGTVSGDGAPAVTGATITITDDDTKGVTVSAASAGLTVRETDDGGTTQTTENVATYTVVLASEPTGDVVIDVEVPAGAPFTASPSSLTFTPSGAGIWSTAQVVTVTAVDDNVDNTGNARSASITHALTVGSSDYGGVSVPGVTVTVTDDDAAPTALTLTVDADTETDNVQASVSEGGGAKTVRVTATLGGSTTFATDKAVTVEVGDDGDSAAEGTDYAMVGTQTVTIKAGASSGHADFTLTPTADSLHEGPETISVEGALSGVTVAGAEITITDDDSAPTTATLAVDADTGTGNVQASLAEGGGAKTVRVTATLGGSSTFTEAKTVTVEVGHADDGATEGTDYETVGRQEIEIAAGASGGHADFTLTPTDDAVDEESETISFKGTADGLTVADAEITLTDDDTKGVTVSAAASGLTVRETDDGGTTETTENVATYTVVLASEPTDDVVIDVEVPAGAPFTASPSRLTFTPGGAGIWSTAQVVTVTAVDDNVDNTGNARSASITHALTVGSSDYGGVSVPGVTVTVADDDGAPGGIALSVDTDSVMAGSQTELGEAAGATTVTVTATVTGGTTYGVAQTVAVTVSGGTATVTDDFTAVTGFNIAIPAGATARAGTFSLTPVNDLIHEGNESINVTGAVSGAGAPTVSAAAVTITDDDPAPTGLTLTVDADTDTPAAQMSVSEGGGTKTVRVTAMFDGSTTFATDKTVAVEVGKTGDSAAEGAGGDYGTVARQDITIKAGASSGHVDFTLTPTDDLLFEGDETISLDGTLAGVTVTDAEITLTDDETVPAVTLHVDPDAVSESGGTRTVTVSAVLDPTVAMANDTTTVTLSLGGTATAGTDYTSSWSPSTPAITFPVGETKGANTVTLTLTPTDDSGAEDDETVVIQGAATTQSRSLVVKVAVITLEDDDAPGVNLSPRSLTVTEGAAATYDVWLGTQPSQDVTVTLSGLDATMATADRGSLTFTQTTWNTRQQVTVNGKEDDLDNAGDKRTTSIRHSAAGGGYDNVDDAVLNVTVADNDDAPSFSIGDASAAEGDAVSFTVSRAGARGAAATVSWHTADDGDGSHPASADDYTAQATVQVLNFDAGDTRKTITVQTAEDLLHEEDETFLVKLSAPSAGATIDDGTAIGTISDDDSAPTTATLAVDADTGTQNTQNSLAEDGGAKTVRVTATLGGSVTFTADKTVTVEVGNTGDTATEGTDYAMVATQTITIKAGASSAHVDFTLTPTQDQLAEGGETISFKGTAAGLTVADARITLTDDDSAPTTATLAVDADTGTNNVQNSLAEGGGAKTVRVTATLGGSVTFTADKTVTVEVGNTGDTATEGTDYAMVATQTITIKAGASSAHVDFTLTPTQDQLAEGDETISFKGTADGLTVADATITLTDDDSAPTTATLAVDADTGTGNVQTSVSEDGGAKTVRVTATLGGSVTFTADKTVTVEVGHANDTATEGTDYAMVATQTITIKAGASSAHVDFTLTPTQDQLAEGGETISFKGTADGLTVADATITLTDDDSAPTTATLAVDADTGTNNVQNSLAEGGGAKTVRVTATLGGSVTFTADKTVTVEVGHADDSASEGTDYAMVATQTITIKAGTSSGYKDFTLTPTQDQLAEGDETISFKGTADGLTVADATITLTDDDSAPTTATLAVDADTGTNNVQNSLAEGGGAKTVRVTATLGGSVTLTADTTVTVEVGHADDSASEGTDYATVGTQTITITAGASSGYKDFTLTPTQDQLAEGDETISFKGTAVGLTVADATITITDDDAARMITILLSAPDYEVFEGESLTVKVKLSESRAADTVIALGPATRTGQTATRDVDYDGSMRTVTIPAGETSGTARIPTTADDRKDPNETFTVAIQESGLSSDVILGEPHTAVVTIREPVTGVTPPETATVEHAGADSAITLTVPAGLRGHGIDVAFRYGTDEGTARSGGFRCGDDGDADLINREVVYSGTPGEVINRPVVRTVQDLDADTVDLQIELCPGSRGKTFDVIWDTTLYLGDPDRGFPGIMSAPFDAAAAHCSSASLCRTRVTIEGGDAVEACVSHSLRESVESHAGETHHGDAHVTRWKEVLAAFGDDNGHAPMTAAEAQAHADKPWPRWNPVVTALRCLEGAAASEDASVLAGPVISLSGGGGIAEGGSATFTVHADPAPQSDLPVTLVVDDDATSDFLAEGDEGTRAVVIQASQASATLTLPTVQDSTDEPDGAVTVTLEAGTGYAVAASPDDAAAVAVTDDDATAVTLTVPDATAVEGDAADTAEIVLTLGRGLVDGESLAVPLLFEGGAAGTLFTLACPVPLPAGVTCQDLDGDPQVTFTGPGSGASATEATLSLSVLDDADSDGETVTVSIPASSGGSAPVLAATGLGGGATGVRTGDGEIAIADDDGTAPEVSIADGGAVTEGGTATFTLTATPPPVADITVRVEVTETGSFAQDGQTGTRNVTVGTGGTGTLAVKTDDDNADEPDGFIRATVLEGTGYAPSSSARRTEVSVADNDVPAGAPMLSVSDATARESDRFMTFTVTLSKESEKHVAFSYRVRESTPVSARLNVDFYGPTHATSHFKPGETERSFRIHIADDTHDEGPETFEFFLWQAVGAGVADAVGVGTILNDDPMPAAWLARFGRTVAEQALDGIADRIAADRTPGVSGSFAGHVDLGSLAARGEAATGEDSVHDTGTALAADGHGIGRVAEDDQGAALALLADDGGGSGNGTAPAFRSGEEDLASGHDGFGDGGDKTEVRSVTLEEAMLATGFTATRGTDAAGGSLAFWGRADLSGFDGREGTFSLDGEAATAMLGADYARGRWLAGLMVMQSSGDGGYSDSGTGGTRCPQELDAEARRVLCGGAVREGDGDVEASLTSAVPYLAYRASERIRLWGALGRGTGEVTLEPETGGGPLAAGLSWSMAAAGLRGDLRAPSGAFPALAVTADALATRTSSEATEELAASESDTSRLRVGIEGSWDVALDGGGRLRPRLEIGARHDGGDAETGLGIELGGGVSWTDPGIGLSLDLSGRTLVRHDDDDLADRGVSLVVTFDPDPASGRGPTISMKQDLGGAASGGIDALFAHDPLEDRAGGDASVRRTLEAAWGLPALGGRFTGSPHAGLSTAGDARDWTLGWRLEPEGERPGTPDLTFGTRAVRREGGDGAATHSVGVEAGISIHF